MSEVDRKWDWLFNQIGQLIDGVNEKGFSQLPTHDPKLDQLCYPRCLLPRLTGGKIGD